MTEDRSVGWVDHSRLIDLAPPAHEQVIAGPPEAEPPVLFWFHVSETVSLQRSSGVIAGQLDPGTWYPAHEAAGEWTSTTDTSGSSGWVPSSVIHQAELGEQPLEPTPPPGTRPLPGQPPAPAGDSTEPARKRHGCRRFFLIIIVLVLIAGLGGFLLIRSGNISLTALQARLSGVGSVTVVNITDDPLQVRITGADETGDSTTIEALDIDGFGALEPGAYSVVIEATNGVPPRLECNLDLARGEDYQFVAVPDGIAVTVDDSAQTADEIDAATSSLCGR
jgi:hypothetical protein